MNMGVAIEDHGLYWFVGVVSSWLKKKNSQGRQRHSDYIVRNFYNVDVVHSLNTMG